MMRIMLVVAGVALGALAACAPQVPDSGVGFGDYDAYNTQIQRSAAQTNAARVRPPETASASVPSSSGDELIDTLSQAVDAAEGRAAGIAPGASTAGSLLTLNNPGLSTEQDFDSVSAERDIAADAERIAAARQQYQLVTPTELQRPDDTGPNIIDYALSARNPVGQKIYRRGVFGASRAAEKCAGYRTDDVAQEEFLSAGGPERDRLGLDPDGDGFACGWNPAVYRNLVQN